MFESDTATSPSVTDVHSMTCTFAKFNNSTGSSENVARLPWQERPRYVYPSLYYIDLFNSKTR